MDLFCLDGYTHFDQTILNKRGGSISIFVIEHLQVHERKDLNLNHDIYESLFIEVENVLKTNGQNVVVGVVYRPPNTSVTYFNDYIKDTMEKLTNKEKNMLSHGRF